MHSTKKPTAAEIKGFAKDKATDLVCRTYNIGMDVFMKTCPWVFRTPELALGCGSRAKIPEILKKYKVTHALIVTGPIVGELIVPEIKGSLEANGIRVDVYDKVEANPSVNTVEAIREMYLAKNCDGFLAVGGGSPMDATKVAAARVVRPRTPVSKMAGLMRVLHPLPPFVVVPTTAGTGSEVTVGAVISDHENQHKFAVGDPFIIPRAAVLDPELTVTLPQFETATTGMDALTHAVESYITWAYHTKFTDQCGEEAVVKIFRNLDKAYEDGNDLEAREEMLIASLKAGMAFTRAGVGYVHCIAHALGGIYNTPHGLACSVIMPYVLDDAGEKIHPQLAHLAELTGVKTSGTQAEKAKAFIAEIRAMNERYGFPKGFDFIKEEDYPKIIKYALAEANTTYAPTVRYNEAHCRHVLNRIVLGV